MSNTLSVPTGSNYAALAGDVVEVIEDAEDLDSYFETPTEEEEEEGKNTPPANEPPPAEEEEEKDEEEEEEEEAPSGLSGNDLISNINNELFGGTLNTAGLPENMTVEQTQSVVNTLIKDILEDSNTRLSHYAEIESLLEDEEVKTFLDMRRAGKSIRDFADSFNAPLDPDVVVKAELKKQMPFLTDIQLDAQLEGMKDNGVFDSYANQLLESQKASSAKSVADALAAKQAEDAAKSQKVQEITNAHVAYLTQNTSIENVNLTLAERQQILNYNRGVDAKTGLTALQAAIEDPALATKAAMGILFFNKLVNTKTKKATVAKESQLMKALYTRPEEASTRRKAASVLDEIDLEALNAL